MDYAALLEQVTDSARFLAQLDVLDVKFVSGHTLELYVANTSEQRSRGLANLEFIDSDGMLFYYDKSTYIPYTMKDMKFNLDIAWFDRNGKLIDIQTHAAGSPAPVVTWRDFSYVIEAPVGMIPHSDMMVV